MLWFMSKVPLLVAQAAGITSVRGGWLDSYIEILGEVDDVNLTVAFPDRTARTPEAHLGGVTFVGLPTGSQRSGLRGVVERWRHEVAPPETLSAAVGLVQDLDPDLIHVFGAENCLGLAVRDCGVPTVLSIQGSPSVIGQFSPRGADRYYLRSLSLTEFLKGRGPVHEYMKTPRESANEAETMASVDHVAGRTEWDRRLASVMAPQATYHRCDEPLRPVFYQVSWSRETAHPWRILSLGGTHYALKGIGTLLRAVEMVRRTAPETLLVLAGVSPGSMTEEVTMRHARALGIQDSVAIVGELEAEDVAREMVQASVFVNSSHMENSSNGFCEAQLLGVPCVASCAGGMPTIAEYGSAALLVQDGDAHALAGALLSLITDQEAAAQLGERGQALARERHAREHIRTQILSMYDYMLK